MNKPEVLETIHEILKKVLKHSDFTLTDELTAADVKGWDSLSHMMIITEIEKGFGIKFKFRELNQLRNMGTLVDLIMSKVNAN
jgi:acyl carrier protein